MIQTSLYLIETGQCVVSTPEYEQEMTYHLNLTDGKWKIIDIELHTYPPKETQEC